MPRHHPENLEPHDPLAVVDSLTDGVGAVDPVLNERFFDQVQSSVVTRREDEVPVVGKAKWGKAQAVLAEQSGAKRDV